MIQEIESPGWEGGLVPAWHDSHSASGGKPNFPTWSFLTRVVTLLHCASLAS